MTDTDDLTPIELHALMLDFEEPEGLTPELRRELFYSVGNWKKYRPGKKERIEIRCTTYEKELITKAANRLAVNRSRFILAYLIEYAEAIEWVFSEGGESQEANIILAGFAAAAANGQRDAERQKEKS